MRKMLNFIEICNKVSYCKKQYKNIVDKDFCVARSVPNNRFPYHDANTPRVRNNFKLQSNDQY